MMIVATRSRWGRRYTDRRYAHTGQIASKQTLRSPGPWGSQLIDVYKRQRESMLVLVRLLKKAMALPIPVERPAKRVSPKAISTEWSIGF